MEVPEILSQESNETISACTCFNCNEESPKAETLSQAELMAGSEGWVLGLGMDPLSDDEHLNAIYACRDCAALLIDTTSVSPLQAAINQDMHDKYPKLA